MTRGIDKLSTGKSPQMVEVGALAVALAASLSACGGSENQADRPSSGETTATVEVTATPEALQCDKSDHEMMAELIQETLESLNELPQSGTWSWDDIPQAQKAETGEVLLDKGRNKDIEATIDRAAEVYQNADNNPNLVRHDDGSIRRKLKSGDEIIMMLGVDEGTSQPRYAFLTILESRLDGGKKAVFNTVIQRQGSDLYSTMVGVEGEDFIDSSKMPTPSDIRTFDKAVLGSTGDMLNILETGSVN